MNIKQWWEEQFRRFPLKDYLLWLAKDIYGVHSTAMIVRPSFAMIVRKK